MGVVNVTPDSFSDGGRFLDPDAAIRHGLDLAAAGADLVDVGGESTRPGAERVPLEIEQARVLPVITELAARGLRVSVDTMNADTAERAIEAGAVIVNDVSGGLVDPRIAEVVAASPDVVYVCSHWRAPSADMDAFAHYDDVVAEVRRELQSRVEVVERAGVDRSRIVLDPGLGFAKRAEHNWALLAGLRAFEALGLPVMVGPSRKRFLTALAEGEDGLDLATAVTAALAAREGVWAVRVHDVARARVALDVAHAWSGGRP